MSKQLLCACIGLALLCGLTQPVSADLVGHWAFDDGAGTMAVDSSGNGNDAVIEGGDDSVWVEGQLGGGVAVGSGVWVSVAPEAWVPIDNQFTVAFWAFGYDGLGNNWGFFATGGGANRVAGSHIPWGDGNVYYDTADASGAWQSERISLAMDAGLVTGVWNHWAFTKNADTGVKMVYLNGEPFHSGANAVGPVADIDTFAIGSGPNGANPYLGVIDDFQLYDVALTQEEIQAAMTGVARGLASVPQPEDAAIDVLRDVTLNWQPGEFAVKHDVYFGTVFDDVNDASAGDDRGVLVSQGQTDASYAAGILEFGQTYFWRVDEVNGAPDNTVFKGAVWSFEVEPFAIPVEVITATASSSNADNMGPENTINGVGLDEMDLHSTEPTAMWLSGMGDAAPSIEYAFDKAYKLDELLVWNSNQVIESFVGIGAKDVVIEYSLDGADWMVLEGATQFAQAPGAPGYAANTVVDFGGVLAQHVKITITGGWGMLPQYGLSAVRFLYIPTFAREPQPADGATTDGANVVLAWRAGREAASHQVNLGTDAADLPLLATTSDSTHTANGLNYGTTYYWQITEVNENQTPTAHVGPIWSFTTPDFGTVDDFEGYDDDCNRIFFAWLDGIGHNGSEECGIAPYNGNGTGSIVGNDVSPFAERDVVHSGNQAMPFLYDSGMSEATQSFAAQDWTASGVQSLSLYFHGMAGNTGQLYIKINNTKVVYDGTAADIASGPWKPWNIDLTAAGGNLQNVTSLTIGIENASAQGTLYIDDILLYPQAVEYITPVEPDAANLLAHYAFDGDFSDSAGNFDGTALGQAQIVSDPVRGQVLSLDGDDDAVDIPSMGESAEITLSAWVNVTDIVTPSDWKSIFHGDGWTAGDVHFRIELSRVDGGINGVAGGDLTSVALVPYEQWTFVAMTMSPTAFSFWVNGYHDITRALDASPMLQMGDGLIGAWLNGENVEREYAGLFDDVRFYNRALTQEELLWLAGQTTPVAKPF